MPPRETRLLRHLLSERNGRLPGRACGLGQTSRWPSVLSYAALHFLGGAAHIWGFANVRGLLSTQVPSLDFPSQGPQRGSPRTWRTGPLGSGGGALAGVLPLVPRTSILCSSAQLWNTRPGCAARVAHGGRQLLSRVEASVVSSQPPGPGPIKVLAGRGLVTAEVQRRAPHPLPPLAASQAPRGQSSHSPGQQAFSVQAGRHSLKQPCLWLRDKCDQPGLWGATFNRTKVLGPTGWEFSEGGLPVETSALQGI